MEKEELLVTFWTVLICYLQLIQAYLESWKVFSSNFWSLVWFNCCVFLITNKRNAYILNQSQSKNIYKSTRTNSHLSNTIHVLGLDGLNQLLWLVYCLFIGWISWGHNGDNIFKEVFSFTNEEQFLSWFSSKSETFLQLSLSIFYF